MLRRICIKSARGILFTLNSCRILNHMHGWHFLSLKNSDFYFKRRLQDCRSLVSSVIWAKNVTLKHGNMELAWSLFDTTVKRKSRSYSAISYSTSVFCDGGPSGFFFNSRIAEILKIKSQSSGYSAPSIRISIIGTKQLTGNLAFLQWCVCSPLESAWERHV